MPLDPWLDETGEFLEVVEVPRLRPPFNLWADPWADLTFLRGLFETVFIPPFDDLADSGLGDEWWEATRREREEKERRREWREERKRMICQYPEVRSWRQPKKGRTARRRTAARQRRIDRKYEEEMKSYRQRPRHCTFEPSPDYDERVMRLPLPAMWIVQFWLLSFIDDNCDYKFFAVDKARECFWPAEPTPKRTLGYELLQLMTPASLRRSASIGVLERRRTSEVAAARDKALALRRSKSEAGIEECAGWNELPKEYATFDDDRDLYIQLVECERQDDNDQWGIDFYYTF